MTVIADISFQPTVRHLAHRKGQETSRLHRHLQRDAAPPWPPGVCRHQVRKQVGYFSLNQVVSHSNDKLLKQSVLRPKLYLFKQYNLKLSASHSYSICFLHEKETRLFCACCARTRSLLVGKIDARQNYVSRQPVT